MFHNSIPFAFVLLLSFICSAEPIYLRFPQDAQSSGVKIQRPVQKIDRADGLVAEVEGDAKSAFYQMDQEWPLASLRQIEFFAMAKQPGFFRFSAQLRNEDGSKGTLYLSPQMVVPDGEFRPLLFDLSQ